MAVIILFGIYVQLMLPVSETVFWICFFVIFYTYAGYPLLVFILVSLKHLIHPHKSLYNETPLPVTLVVAAFNEEEIIKEKIINSLSLNYPDTLLKILFISDGSTDSTASIIREYPQILHLHEPERKGKLAALNRAMGYIETAFVIFSDANTFLNKESINKIMAHYADPKVGGVAGEKKIAETSEGEYVAKGEGYYWKYESFIKKLDSRLYTVVGAAGELFSMRTSLYTQLPENIIIEDFVQSLLVCAKGYVVRYEPSAYALEQASFSITDEMERKTRISAGGFQAMAYLQHLFNIFRHPVLSFQYISHRVLRWTICPVAMILLLLASLAIWMETHSIIMGYFILLQALFYLLALAGWVMARKKVHPGILYLPFYFVFMNFCVFAGFARYLGGRQDVVWKKVDRNRKI